MKMTRAEAIAYRARWATVDAAERGALLRTPPELKLRQLAALMASVNDMGWQSPLANEDESVRDRWRRLRLAYGA